MNELLKYRKGIIRLTIILILVEVAAVGLLLAASPSFERGYISLILLIVILVQILLTARLGMAGNKTAVILIQEEQERAMAASDEQQIEHAAQSANDIVETKYDINDITKLIKKADNWKDYGDSILYSLSKQIDIAVGMVYHYANEEFYAAATFAYYNDEAPRNFKIGEGISGQVAKDKKAMFLNDLPSKSLMIVSGLGQIEVNNLAIIPILKDDNVLGLIEIATFKPFDNWFINKIDEISNAIGGMAPAL